MSAPSVLKGEGGALKSQPPGELFKLVVFSVGAAEALNRFNDGDIVSLASTAIVCRWRADDGTACHGLDIFVHAVSASNRPGFERNLARLAGLVDKGILPKADLDEVCNSGCFLRVLHAQKATKAPLVAGE